MKIKVLSLILLLLFNVNSYGGFWTGVIVSSVYHRSKSRSYSSGCSCDSSHGEEVEDVPVNVKTELEISLEKINAIGHLRIKEFIEKHRIYFVCTDEFSYCNETALSPAVKKAKDILGVDVTAISLDSEELQKFPDFIARFKLWSTQALLIIDSEASEILSVSYGSKGEGQIINWFAGVLFEWKENVKNKVSCNSKLFEQGSLE